MHDNRVLILKRSDKVATMKGHWGGVSGYLEGDEAPYSRALKELKEEVALEADDVQLIRGGNVIKSRDISRDDLIWMVHTFLFNVKDPDKIRLDWEHDECRWIQPRQIGTYQTVPRLKEALMQLLSNTHH
ncbi:MAG: NUDIX domain-containing protein [Thaumarchaeota archaeon]|nr:NUDIX domain-containing protein [Nitrososphaerota archaeon]